MVSSNLGVRTSPRNKIYFLFLSISNDELFSSRKLITFLSQSKFGSEKSERESNPISYLE